MSRLPTGVWCVGKKLPDDLVEVLNLIGIDWPNIDEDEVKSSAKDYRNLAEGIRDAVKEGNNACSHIVGGKSKGATVTAIDRRWGKLTTRDLATFAKGCDALADALDECAALILACKIAIIAELTATGVAATAGVVGMFFTAGISGLLSAAAVAAARLIIQEAIDYAIGEITAIVTDKIEAKILAEIEELFSDRLGGGATYDVMASGEADMAQDLVIEFDEFDRASGGYKETADNFDKKKGTFKGGGAQRKTSVKKDSRFHKLATVMDKAEDTVDKKSDEMVKTLEDHGGKIDKSKSDQRNEDEERKREIDRCKVDSGDTPMYLLNADGTVEQLHANGTTSAVSKTDNSGIRDLMTEPGKGPNEVGRVWRPRKGQAGGNPYPVSPSKDTAKVTSRRVDPGSTDLSRATQIARYHNSDWGGGNYAAGRYVDGSGKEMILVTNSEGPHSERTLGYPILKAEKKDNLTELYTERQPCQGSPSWCDKWTAKYFDPELKVTHSQAYLNSDSPNVRDLEHEKYRDQLAKDHKTHGVTGGFT
ncbi:nucleic acid/nucleotide deaminase domain-containing protein [Streptomyces sp. NBC_01506]|uniref:WXG100-like domain-containing protein n=1 Tax=Streptomyces sp. NBC_01506 TaxID=2903887 RepID=UPI00386E1761